LSRLAKKTEVLSSTSVFLCLVAFELYWIDWGVDDGMALLNVFYIELVKRLYFA